MLEGRFFYSSGLRTWSECLGSFQLNLQLFGSCTLLAISCISICTYHKIVCNTVQHREDANAHILAHSLPVINVNFYFPNLTYINTILTKTLNIYKNKFSHSQSKVSYFSVIKVLSLGFSIWLWKQQLKSFCYIYK